MHVMHGTVTPILALSLEHYPLEQYRESTRLLRIHRAMSFSLFFCEKTWCR